MKVLVFDTETTGLPTERNASIMDTNKWPYILQLSYVVYDTEEHLILDCVDDIIKIDSEKIKISAETTAIHGITNEICDEKGVLLQDALKKFNEILLNVDMIVGHNISFDKQLVMVECNRNNIRQKFTINGVRKPEYCTMKRNTELCGIEIITPEGKKYFKYPSLSYLYTHLFKCDPPKNVHNALVDVLVCLRCYIYVQHNVDIIQLIKDRLIPTF